MVKRQTVWLSTMMVLSLMLIGYYTINSGGSGESDAANTVATTTDTPTTNTSTATNSMSNSTSGSAANATTSGGSSSTGNVTGTGSKSGSTSSTDWFAESQTQIQQQMTKNTDMYEQIMASSKSTNADVAQAQQDLEQTQAIEGGMQNARDAILGDGYEDAVIFPTVDTKTGGLTQVNVYVKAKSLSTNKAVQIMNIVSQHMNVPLDQITVHEHA